MSVALRAPTAEDIDVWLEIVLAVDAVDVGEPDYTMEDVRSEWASPRFDLATDAWLAEVDGVPVGHGSAWHAVPGTLVMLDSYVLPEHAAVVEPLLLERMVARSAEFAAADGKALDIHTGNMSVNVVRGETYAAQGFAVVRKFHRMTIDFDGPPAPPSLPPGTTVEAVGAEGAHIAHGVLLAAFRDHWGTGTEPWDEWRQSHVEHGDFDPELLLVASVDGVPAAAVLGWMHPSGAGKVRELGVLADYRRRGLGEALLRESFVRFHARGWTGAQLGVDTENLTGAPRLYERVGMHVANTIDVWERRIEPAG